MTSLTPLGQILAAILIAVLSGMIGKYIGSSRKVSLDQCYERRQACNALVLEKLDALDKKVTSHIECHNREVRERTAWMHSDSK